MDIRDDDVAGIGELADRTRRELYLFVCSRAEPVTREQAAAGVGITVHQAKFHLDRMAAGGLLEAEYARDPGRGGPGAGRPAKRYRRSQREFSVSLPGREYELAGRLMADAITRSADTGAPVMQTLQEAAVSAGRRMADDVAETPAASAPQALSLAEDALRRYGYEPRREGEQITLANCPFHGLVTEHPDLVCRMNHALLSAMAERIDPEHLVARLEPEGHACCVVLAAAQHRTDAGLQAAAGSDSAR